VERTSVVLPSILAAVAVIAIDVLYVSVIAAQGGAEPGSKVPYFVSGYLAVMAALVALALAPQRELEGWRVPLRAAASGGLLVLGMIAALSIGVLLVGAGLLVGFALARTESRPAQWWTGVVASLASVAVLIAGFQLTEGLFF
jgi:hypothetical protein